MFVAWSSEETLSDLFLVLLALIGSLQGVLFCGAQTELVLCWFQSPTGVL